MGQYVDLTGQTFGRLKVLYRTEDHVSKSGRHDVVYRCKCSCGNERDVSKSALTRGFTQSCGCLRSEVTRERRTKRDEASRKLRVAYIHMISRCYDINDKRYDRYGGRGICVCDEWRNNGVLEKFIAWAKSNGYEQGLSIDRIDNDGNYCPENCRWTTAKEQSNNRSSNTVLTVDGVTKTIAQWIEFLGLKSTRIYYYDQQKQIEFIRSMMK